MKPTIEQIGDLLALKRHERPDEGYWQNFICEFHQNQREQAVKTTRLTHIFSQANAWISEVGPSKWAYGAGLAYAAVTVAFFLVPREAVKPSTPVTPVNFQVVPTPAPPALEQLNHLDLSPSTQGNIGEQVF